MRDWMDERYSNFSRLIQNSRIVEELLIQIDGGMFV